MLTKEEIQKKLEDRTINYSEVARETGLTDSTVRKVRDTGKCNNATRKLLSEHFEKIEGKQND